MSADTSLDAVFTEVGEFGLFQTVTYLLIAIPGALAASTVVSYMFAANTLQYRCKVPECDVGESNRAMEFDQPWLHYAIPSSNNQLKNCVRYAPIETNAGSGNVTCNANMFNTSVEIACSEFIYASDEKNIQTELNIHCSDSYKLALVGTINNIGRFLILPFFGILSDRFGRVTVVVAGTVCASLIGIVKSFSTNYFVYIALEFLESMGSTTFNGMYVLALEWVNAKYRVMGSMILSLSFPIGEMILGVVAMYIHDFRILIRVLYSPGLIIIIYLWLIPESVRWLLVNGQVDRAIKILKRMARVNGKQLSDKTIEMLKLSHANKTPEQNNLDKQSMWQSLKSILKSKTLIMRFVSCCYQWMCCSFCYYGLSMIAIHIPGENRYISFIYVVAIEIPGLLISFPLLNKLKRKPLMIGSLLLTALSTIATSWISREHSTLILIFCMLGKAAITCAYNVVYIFTAEQWPTNIRATTMFSCSMIAKAGAMVAPMTAILAAQYDSLPAVLFAGSAMLGAISVFLCPETFSKKLPDTIEEARDLE